MRLSRGSKSKEERKELYKYLDSALREGLSFFLFPSRTLGSGLIGAIRGDWQWKGTTSTDSVFRITFL